MKEKKGEVKNEKKKNVKFKRSEGKLKLDKKKLSSKYSLSL